MAGKKRRDKQDDKNREKDVKQDFRDTGRGGCYAAESEHGRY